MLIVQLPESTPRLHFTNIDTLSQTLTSTSLGQGTEPEQFVRFVVVVVYSMARTVFFFF